MSSACVMKQLHEKHMTSEITHAVWSPTMDLLAVANATGEITLHRLSWQKVWTHTPEAESIRVTGMAWRPDSKILAAGLSIGKIRMFNIENGETVHEISTNDQEITSICWAGMQTESNENSEDTIIEDGWSQHMYPLPDLGRTKKCTRDPIYQNTEPGLLRGQHKLTILVFSCSNRKLFLYAFGIFHVATFTLEHTNRILDVTASPDMSMFKLVIEYEKPDGSKYVDLMMLDTSILSSRAKQIARLAKKYGVIHCLVDYIGFTRNHLEEAWESALLEIDVKLESLASKVPVGAVTADMLQLVVFGTATTELELFLTHELTERGLKKLKACVETSYANMQKLLAKNLQTIGLTLFSQLTHITGLAKSDDSYATLGVDEMGPLRAQKETASLMLKVTEMLQVIDASLKNFRCFLKWLAFVKLRHGQEPPQRDVLKVTPEDMSNTVKFLNECLETGYVDEEGNKKRSFQLERVGQYLKRAPLKKVDPNGATPWAELVAKNKELENSPHIYTCRPERSFAMENEAVNISVKILLQKPPEVISPQVQKISSVKLLGSTSGDPLKLDQMANIKGGFIYTAFIPPTDPFCVYIIRNCAKNRQTTYAAKYSFTASDSSKSDKNDRFVLSVIDLQFYNQSALSLLLQNANDPRSVSFAQLRLDHVLKDMKAYKTKKIDDISTTTDIPCKDASQYFDSSCYRKLDVGPSSGFSVSGSRKVAAIFGENRRRVKVYEMEADEDEEEETATEGGASFPNASKD